MLLYKLTLMIAGADRARFYYYDEYTKALNALINTPEPKGGEIEEVNIAGYYATILYGEGENHYELKLNYSDGCTLDELCSCGEDVLTHVEVIYEPDIEPRKRITKPYLRYVKRELERVYSEYTISGSGHPTLSGIKFSDEELKWAIKRSLEERKNDTIHLLGTLIARNLLQRDSEKRYWDGKSMPKAIKKCAKMAGLYSGKSKESSKK